MNENTTTPEYIIITVGTMGDLHPFMCIAHALQEIGRKVTFVTSAYYEDLLKQSGLSYILLGTSEEFRQALANPDIWDMKKAFSTMDEFYPRLLKQLVQYLKTVDTHKNQVTIVHPLIAPGVAIARELGLIKSIVVGYLAPSNIRTCYDPLIIGAISVPRWVPMSIRRVLWWLIEKRFIDPMLTTSVNAIRQTLNLPKAESFFTHIAKTSDLSVTLFPSWYAPVLPDWPQPLLVADFQLFESKATQDSFTQELSTFLNKGKKPFVFTPGTGHYHAADFFAHALTAVESLGHRAIFLTKDRTQIPENLPESVLWQPYVPLSKLLAHTAVLIHHGGIGTTAEALRAGIPQLIVPFAWDQFDNGARIASLGVGMTIPAKQLKHQNLTESLNILYRSESIRENNLQLASRFVPPYDPMLLCKEIEDICSAKPTESDVTLS